MPAEPLYPRFVKRPGQLQDAELNLGGVLGRRAGVAGAFECRLEELCDPGARSTGSQAISKSRLLDRGADYDATPDAVPFELPSRFLSICRGCCFQSADAWNYSWPMRS